MQFGQDDQEWHTEKSRTDDFRIGKKILTGGAILTVTTANECKQMTFFLLVRGLGRTKFGGEAEGLTRSTGLTAARSSANNLLLSTKIQCQLAIYK